jgi:hypothetical protein
MNPPSKKTWRITRNVLLSLALCATLIAIYYTEELWRGKRAWENCRRTMETQGLNFNWADHIPAPVPANENFFAVPEMQQWFVGRGPTTELEKKLPDTSSWWSNRMIVAELAIGRPDATAPDGYVTLRWDDPSARGEAARLLTNAVGPTATAPQSPMIVGFMTRRLEEIHPARIFLQRETAPTEKELKEFLPDTIFVHAHYPPRKEALNFEPAGNGSYHVSLPVLETANDYLTLTRTADPSFALIRQALSRPSARMDGQYNVPAETPIPNFRSARAVAQTLTSRAQCHFLLGQPEEALPDLTLVHDMCHPIMEQNQPMTLVGAMINVAVAGLYADTIADGIQLHAWREPQLAALEEQLKQVKLLVPLKESFKMETVFLGTILPDMSSKQLLGLVQAESDQRPPGFWKHRKDLLLTQMMPRGWVYQNLVAFINLRPIAIAAVDPVNELIFPDKCADFAQREEALVARGSPYAFLENAMTPNFSKACQTAARNQTRVKQTLIACALERYHLAHGQYPETLDALIPQYLDTLPNDVIGGAPFHYRPAAHDTFLLYSIGWNARDDGGVRGQSVTEGDWVWPYGP